MPLFEFSVRSGAAGQAKEPATIFSFFSCKGGSGSTTISTNFAVSLSKLSKKKILVLDLDVELGDVAGFFGLKSPKSLVEEDSRRLNSRSSNDFPNHHYPLENRN